MNDGIMTVKTANFIIVGTTAVAGLFRLLAFMLGAVGIQDRQASQDTNTWFMAVYI